MHPYREKAIPDPEPPCKVLDIVRCKPSGRADYYQAIIKTELGFAKVISFVPLFRQHWRFKETQEDIPKQYWPTLDQAARDHDARELSKAKAAWKTSEDAAIDT